MSTTTGQEVAVKPTNGNGQLAHHDDSQLASTPPDWTALATNPNVDADKLRQIWEIRKEVLAEAAKVDYAEAMAACQGEFPVLGRDAYNDQTKSRYARFETIWDACCPIWTKHGFSVAFETITTAEERLRMTCVVRHRGGHVERVPIADTKSDTTGAKGTTNKTEVQGNQSAMTYLKRGALCSAMGIVTRYEDDDGNSAGRRQQQNTNHQRSEQHQPSDDALGNQWALKAEQALRAAGKSWPETLRGAFRTAQQRADLEALVELVRDNVASLPQRDRDLCATELQAARNRLTTSRMMDNYDAGEQQRTAPGQADGTEQPSQSSAAHKQRPAFEAILIDATGQPVDGEVHTDPVAFVTAYVQQFEETFPADRDQLLANNVDALEGARKNPDALRILMGGKSKPPSHSSGSIRWDSGSIPHEPVEPPKNRGKPSWPTWLNLFRDELATTHVDLPGWFEAQKPIMAQAPVAQRALAIKAITEACEREKVQPPTWLAELIGPAKPDPDAEWSERTISEVNLIDRRDTFDAMVNNEAIRTKMLRLRSEKPELFQRVNQAFDAKHIALGGVAP